MTDRIQRRPRLWEHEYENWRDLKRQGYTYREIANLTPEHPDRGNKPCHSTVRCACNAEARQANHDKVDDYYDRNTEAVQERQRQFKRDNPEKQVFWHRRYYLEVERGSR